MPLSEAEEICREQILSEDYLDLIIESSAVPNRILANYGAYCFEDVNTVYGIAHLNRSRVPSYSIQSYGYRSIPSLFSLQDTTSMQATGILRAQTQPIPNLRGQGVLIGFIDTGIDYSHPAFRKSDGETRIVSIWDQTIQTGDPPAGMLYGTEYQEDIINQALRTTQPRELVPTMDTVGHGTFMAGIAAGSGTADESFIGAAPEATIAMVKLKEAKDNLKEFYYVTSDTRVYQESDVMMGVRYLLELRERMDNIPLVIYIGLGSNKGGHDGFSPLEEVLNRPTNLIGIVPVIPTGNDRDQSHHYYGEMSPNEEYRDVEVRVQEGETGFRLDLWGQPSELFSVGFISPAGESVPRIAARIRNSDTIDFLLERTVLYVDYSLVSSQSGSQLISIGFQDPTPGIWVVRVYSTNFVSGVFHMWLPIAGQILPNTEFLEPNPDTTLSIPSTSLGPITVAAFNHRNESNYIHSGRGYTRLIPVKPDLSGPGVEVYGPAPGGRYVTRSGTSIGAAHVAGAAADLLYWGIIQGNDPLMGSNVVKAYLIRGARRSTIYSYPNRGSGFGLLDLYGVFQNLRIY